MNCNPKGRCAINQLAQSRAKLIASAERELSAFFSAVAGSFGPEEATLAAKDWLQQLEAMKALPDSPGQLRLLSISAAVKLAKRVTRRLLIVGLCLFVMGVVNAQTPDPSPVDAPQPEVRPALGPFPRFQDWSFLRDRSLRVDPYDRLKFIPLNDSGTNYLTLGVENRTEFQYLKNNAWGAGRQDLTGYVVERLMLTADLDLGNHARIFVTLAFDDVGNKKAGPRPVIDKNVADGHEGFVEFGGNLHDRHPGWDVIVGRQEVALGTGRLLADNEGVNVRSTFDGVRIGYDRPKGRIDLIAVKPGGDQPWRVGRHTQSSDHPVGPVRLECALELTIHDRCLFS